MREAFEKWVRSKGWDANRTMFGDYEEEPVQAFWAGWKACWEYRNDNH